MNHKANILPTLGIIFIVCTIVWGTYTYSVNLKTSIENKKEIEQLQKEKLRLEIEILKKNI